MPVDITQNIRGFEQGKKHKKDGLSQEEVLRIRNWMLTTPEYDKKSHIRRKAIFSLLLLQGLRQIEISRLDIKDVDFSQNVIWVRGKGRHDKERVDLHPLAVGYLYDYFSMYNIPFIHANKALFFSISNSSQGHRITTRGLRTLVTDVFREIGIKKSVHGCRHYFTTQLIKSFKGDLLKVKRYTRHKSVEMLQVYFDDLEAKEDLPEFYKAFDEVFF